MRANKADSTIFEINFKNHVGTAPRRGLFYRHLFLKFKVSFTCLKVIISAGVIWIFLGLIIRGYSAFINPNSPFKSKPSSPKHNLSNSSPNTSIYRYLKLQGKRLIFQVFLLRFSVLFFTFIDIATDLSTISIHPVPYNEDECQWG